MLDCSYLFCIKDSTLILPLPNQKIMIIKEYMVDMLY